MREIKFKAFHKARNQMCDVIRIDGIGTNMTVQVSFTTRGKTGYKKEVWLKGDEYNLVQYTGLKDKNGKEIYENDILKVTDPYREDISQHIVKWDNGDSSFIINCPLGDGDYSSLGQFLYEDYEFEIIGNICENPELLEAK